MESITPKEKQALVQCLNHIDNERWRLSEEAKDTLDLAYQAVSKITFKQEG